MSSTMISSNVLTPFLTPHQVFEENMRPAELLLRVYRLLENDEVHTEHTLIEGLRPVIGTKADEYLLLIHNSIFVGLIREGAQINPGYLKKSALCNLLRQSVAAACTALDTFLPSLLRAHIGTVIKVKKHHFIPTDGESKNFFKDITLSLTEAVRLIDEPDPVFFLWQKMESTLKDRASGNATAIHAIGSTLGVDNPWARIGDQLGRNGNELKQLLNDTVKRRNDIIHRSDRSKTDPDGLIQEIAYSWTMQAVDNIKHVCTALDELVNIEIHAMTQLIEETPAETA